MRGRRIRCTLRADELGDERALKAALMGATGGIDAIYKGAGAAPVDGDPNLPTRQGALSPALPAHRMDRRYVHGVLIPGREIERTIIELPGKLPYSMMPGKPR